MLKGLTSSKSKGGMSKGDLGMLRRLMEQDRHQAQFNPVVLEGSDGVRYLASESASTELADTYPPLGDSIRKMDFGTKGQMLSLINRIEGSQHQFPLFHGVPIYTSVGDHTTFYGRVTPLGPVRDDDFRVTHAGSHRFNVNAGTVGWWDDGQFPRSRGLNNTQVGASRDGYVVVNFTASPRSYDVPSNNPNDGPYYKGSTSGVSFSNIIGSVSRPRVRYTREYINAEESAETRESYRWSGTQQIRIPLARITFTDGVPVITQLRNFVTVYSSGFSIGGVEWV